MIIPSNELCTFLVRSKTMKPLTRYYHYSELCVTEFICVYSLSFLLFMILFDCLCYQELVLFFCDHHKRMNHSHLIREWNCLHTFAPYLTKEGSCFFILPCTKCLVILKSLSLLPDVNNLMCSWYLKPLTHSGQSRTFTLLKTVLGKLMNACIQYDKQSAWY